MKPKQLTLIVLMALVLGGAGLLITRQREASYQTSGSGLGGKVLPEFPLNDVAGVVINDGTNTLHLKKQDGVWKLEERYGYPADYADLSSFLREVWELKAVQSEKASASDRKRLQLVEPGEGGESGGTLVSFSGADGKPVAKLILGKQKMRKSATPSQFGEDSWPDGRWVYVAGSGDNVALVDKAFSNIKTEADQWIDKEFFKVEKLKSAEVTHGEATNSWRIFREVEAGELKLADTAEGEELDTGKAAPVGNLLSWPSFIDVADPGLDAATAGMESPVVAKLETFEGLSYTVKVGGAVGTNDNYYVQVSVAGSFPESRQAPEGESDEDKARLDQEFKEKTEKLQEKLKKEQRLDGWTYIVSKWTVENLLKNRADFLKVEEPAAEVDGAGGGALPDPTIPPLPPALDFQ